MGSRPRRDERAAALSGIFLAGENPAVLTGILSAFFPLLYDNRVDMPRIQNLKIEIPRLDVLKRLHYNIYKTEVSDEVDNLIDKMIKEAYILIHTKAVYRDFAVSGRTETEVRLAGTDFAVVGREVGALLRNSHKVTLCAMTVGEDLPRRSHQYMSEGKNTEGVILDAVGSEAVETLAEKVSAIVLRNAMLEGALTTKRYSPGYGDWRVEEQRGLLKAVGANEIGIDLNPACLMIPEKSVSAVIGWER